MEEDAGGSSALPPEEGYLLVRIHVPELNVQKCLQFPRDQLVWDVKQQCLAALPKVTNRSLNTERFGQWDQSNVNCLGPTSLLL
jgi:SH3/ankyrin repeat-containing protein